MTIDAGPLFEFTFRVEREVSDDFDHWLTSLVRDAAVTDGVADARSFNAAEQGDLVSRICQIQCDDDNALDQLQDGLFADTDAEVAAKFGNTVVIASRVLREDFEQAPAVIENPNCLNCGAHLRGQYCGNCGQRARNRLISLWELITDAFGDLFEIDSRLWRTLIPLLARPGRLTRDYLEGRRARYMPPFRSYLVLSLIFFVVAFFDPRDDLSLLFEPEPEATAEEAAEKAAQAEEARQEILDELAEEGIIVGDADPGDPVDAAEQLATEEANDTHSGLNIQIDDDTGACNIDGDDLTDMPEWFQRRFSKERIQGVCERVTADSGKNFVGLLLDNIPVALIVLLPLMALVLKILYPLSRRYFVEHLLFFIHYHAFFFLILTLQILFARVTALLHVPEALSILMIVAASFYIPVYLYMAMRRVYGQGHILTFIKYVALLVAYSIGATLTMLGAALFALVAV